MVWHDEAGYHRLAINAAGDHANLPARVLRPGATRRGGRLAHASPGEVDPAGPIASSGERAAGRA